MNSTMALLKRILKYTINKAKKLKKISILIVFEFFHRLKFTKSGTYAKLDSRLINHHPYSFSKSKKQLSFFPVALDVKQTEVVSNLLIDNQESEFVNHPWESSLPVYNIVSSEFESDFCRNKPKLSFILDLHDIPNKNNHVYLSNKVLRTINTNKLRVILIKLQFDSLKSFPLINPLPMQIHVISMPMLLGGSRFHITLQNDYDGDKLFSKNLNSNKVIPYKYDWSWIGGETSEDRKTILKMISRFDRYSRYFSITNTGHPDANKASVPFNQYINISRVSKICLSLNGAGLWCLKDGELFSNNCFVMRQNHPSINLNPLSPKNGIHWILFDNNDIINKFTYYIENNNEREQIRMNGFQYFNEGIVNKKWAKFYLSHLLNYLKTEKKEAWGNLSVI